MTDKCTFFFFHKKLKKVICIFLQKLQPLWPFWFCGRIAERSLPIGNGRQARKGELQRLWRRAGPGTWSRSLTRRGEEARLEEEKEAVAGEGSEMTDMGTVWVAT